MIENQSKVYTAAFLREHKAAYPLGGGAPENVSDAIVFLLSAKSVDDGCELTVDGGYLA